MKATAVETQAAHPPGHPACVPMPSSCSLTLATGVVGLVGLTGAYAVAAPFDQQAMRRIFLVAAPMNIATSFPSFSPQGLTGRAGGLLIQMLSVLSIALQASLAGVFAYTLGQAGQYAEGRVQDRVRRKVAKLLPPETDLRPGDQLTPQQGDTLVIYGELTEGSLTVERRRWGPPVLEVLQAGQRVAPGDTVLAGQASIRVERAESLDTVDMDPCAQPLNGVTSLRPGHDPMRLRKQFWWWSVAVAAGTLLLGGGIHRALGVILAGSPVFLDVVGGATEFRETATWERKGLLVIHPLGLVAAGEVDTVLFDEPAAPSEARLRELAHVADKLRQDNYRVGLLTGADGRQAEQAARAIGADLWYSGPPEDRARCVADLYRHRLVAVVGRSRESVPAMATAHLALGTHDVPEVAAASHVVMTGALDHLPDFMADNRETGRAEQHGETITRTLVVAATLAAGIGLLAATNVVTVTSLLGLGMIGVKKVLGGGKKGRSSAVNRYV